jgi:hypothetical protein
MKKYSLQLTAEQIQVIESGLVELPFKLSAPILNEISKQLQAAVDSETDSQTN